MADSEVGRQFVKFYFNALFQDDKKKLLSLYKENSTLTRADGNEIKTFNGLEVNLQAKPNILCLCFFYIYIL